MYITLSVKNANPKLYGYGSLKALKESAPHYGDDGKELAFYVIYKDADEDIRFIPCEEEYYKSYRAMLRDELESKDLESRCSIPADYFVENGVFVRKPDKNPHKDYKKCMHDCKHCPYLYNPDSPDEEISYVRTGNPKSLNTIVVNSEGDEDELINKFADETSLNPEEYTERAANERAIANVIAGFNSNEQKILNLFNNGYSDSEIGKALGTTKQNIQAKRSKLIMQIKEKLKIL